MHWDTFGVGFVAGVVVSTIVAYATVKFIAYEWPKD